MNNKNYNLKTLFSEKAFLIVLLLLSVVLNFFLAFEVKNLKSNLKLINDKTEHQIMIGRTVPALEVKNLEGEDVKINYNDTKKYTIIYLYSPDCIWCERNLQNILHLYNENKERFNFVGLSLQKDSATEYTKDNNITFPVYINPSESNQIDYNFRATPSTYVISPDGKIVQYWSGAYGTKNLSSIEDFFKVKLPGLSE